MDTHLDLTLIYTWVHEYVFLEQPVARLFFKFNYFGRLAKIHLNGGI